MKKLDLPDFSKLTIEIERKERNKLKERIEKARKKKELNLLVRYTYDLYKKGYLNILPSITDIKEYLEGMK